MDASDRLGLPLLAAGQLQKHITLNEALTRLDVLVQCRAASRSADGPPEDPPGGELHIVAIGAATGAWADCTPGDLVRAEPGGWAVETAPDGMIAAVADEGRVLIRHGGDWRLLGWSLGEVQNVTRLGLNTLADADNPFAVRTPRALFAAPGGDGGGDGGDDLRMVLNKTATADVVSLLFQTGWQGRAEIGLIGDDDLTLKIADDAGGWREALRIDRATGRADFASGAGRVETTVLTAGTTWTPPVWARRVEARVVAGGGGGGSGAAGAAGTARFGAGGGGAGGMARAVWKAADLAGGVVVVVGTGGNGGAAASPGPGSGTGSDGADGGETCLSLAGVVRLRALGGRGGKGGGTTSGVAASGGQGLGPANPGGAGRVDGPADPGGAWDRSDGPGGGGGGGGLDASGTACPGGVGGAGATAGSNVAGGAGGAGVSGGDGTDAETLFWPWAGGGGGGGSASASGGGHVGGEGARGAGGGGGGAGLTLSGAGGRGGNGCVVLTAVG